MSEQPLLQAGTGHDSVDICCGSAVLGSTDIADAACRICHGGLSSSGADPLLSPCLCVGSVRWVHRSCLDNWRASCLDSWQGRGTRPLRVDRCELCHAAYVYELRKMSCFDAAVRLLQRSTGHALPVVAMCVLFSAVTSAQVATLMFFVVLGFWAARDVALSIVARCKGGGVLGDVVRQLVVATLPQGPQADAAAEAMAQTIAAEEAAQAAVRIAAVRDAVALDARRLPQPQFDEVEGDIVDQREGAGAGDDESQESLCCSFACLVQAIAFLLVPPVVASSWAALRYAVGTHGMELGALLLAGLGACYWPLVAALCLTASIRRPPLCAVRGASGLPAVRCRLVLGMSPH